MPYEVFENDMTVAGQDSSCARKPIRSWSCPPVEVIPYATLAKVKAFFEPGGVVVGHGFLPTQSATLGKTAS